MLDGLFILWALINIIIAAAGLGKPHPIIFILGIIVLIIDIFLFIFCIYDLITAL